jgi:hypothetical protein
VIIVRVGAARRAKRRHRAVAIAEPVADGAEREPGGGEARRRLDRLRQNIGRGGKIAARGEDTNKGPLLGPVSVMQSSYNAVGTLAPGTIMIIYDS